jgi:hypothetical protein
MASITINMDEANNELVGQIMDVLVKHKATKIDDAVGRLDAVCTVVEKLPEQPNPVEILKNMEQRQENILCRLRSLRNLMNDLQADMQQDSTEGARHVRLGSTYIEHAMDMYTLDSRSKIKRQCEKIGFLHDTLTPKE